METVWKYIKIQMSLTLGFQGWSCASWLSLIDFIFYFIFMRLLKCITYELSSIILLLIIIKALSHLLGSFLISTCPVIPFMCISHELPMSKHQPFGILHNYWFFVLL